jgi:hypothetical protein
MGLRSRTRDSVSAGDFGEVAEGSREDSELTREMNEAQIEALRESLDALDHHQSGNVVDLTSKVPAKWSADTMSVAEAVDRCGIAPSALRRALHQGRFPNAFRTATADPEAVGPWRIPVSDLIAAGFVQLTAVAGGVIEPSAEPAPEQPRSGNGVLQNGSASNGSASNGAAVNGTQ